MQTLRVNNSRIPRTTNAKFSEYHFYLKTNIYRDFQICISVPLIEVVLYWYVLILTLDLLGMFFAVFQNFSNMKLQHKQEQKFVFKKSIEFGLPLN